MSARPRRRAQHHASLTGGPAFDFIRVHSRGFAGKCIFRSENRTGGFTLLEVLLSIAIIALIASVLIGGSIHLISTEPATLEDVFWKSVQETRKAALKAEHEMRLKYDGEKKQFVILDGVAPTRLAADGVTKEEVPVKTFPLPATMTADTTLDLLSATKSGAMVLIGGVLMESRSLPFVTFYPDGTCGPFRLQIARPTGAHTLNVDPWTCAPMLTPADPNAPATL